MQIVRTHQREAKELAMTELIKTETFHSPVSIGRAKIERNGLTIEEGLERNEWINEVIVPLKSMIDTMNGSMQWWWGDALAYGERRYGDTYASAITESDYTYGTLRIAKLVAERIPLLCRHNNLSWSHHAEVAMCIDDQAKRDEWLRRAEKEQLSKSDLRKAIRQSKAVYNDPPNTDAGQFEAIRGAKELRAYLPKTPAEVAEWTPARCLLWVDDLRPIADSFQLIFNRSRE